MIPFGYLEGDNGVVLIQLDVLDGEPGEAPCIELDPETGPRLLRDGRYFALSDARPDLMQRLPRAREVHVVEFDADAVCRCYQVAVARAT